MSNWNLKSFDNLYASLAESAYRDRPNKFPYEQLDPESRKKFDSGKSIEFNFSIDAKDKDGQITKGGGTDLPNGGNVYLQPDNKKLLEDEETGYTLIMSQILIRSTRIRTRLIFRFVEVMVLELIYHKSKKVILRNLTIKIGSIMMQLLLLRMRSSLKHSMLQKG